MTPPEASSLEPLRQKLGDLVTLAGGSIEAFARADECLALAQQVRDDTAYAMMRFGQENPQVVGCGQMEKPNGTR